MMHTRLFRLMLTGLAMTTALSGAGPVAAAETITLATYHTHPPFLIGAGEGLTHDLARELTERSAGAYRFEVEPMSRPRLNKQLEEGRRMVVPWVSPLWFGDAEEKRYGWVAESLMRDGNAIVSPVARPVDYTGPESLEGLRFGGQRGHRYVGIDDYILGSQTTRRIDADTHDDNLERLERGLIDVTLVPDSAVRYVIRSRGLGEVLYISPTPHTSYERRMLVSAPDPALLAYLEQALQELAADPGWLEKRGN